MGRLYRYTTSSQFRCMDIISPYHWCCFHDPINRNSCLQQLIRDDQTDVPSTHHEHSLTRFYPIDVHERLNRTSAIHTRKVISWEQQHIFHSTTSKDYCVTSNIIQSTLIVAALNDTKTMLFVTFIITDDRRIGHHLDFSFFLKFPHISIPILLRYQYHGFLRVLVSNQRIYESV